MISLTYSSDPNWSWYDKNHKKPTLQLKILYLLSTHGNLSMSMAQNLIHKHHLPDISDAIGKMNDPDRNLIKEKEFKGKWHKLGKRPICYQLTEQGMAALISENPHPDTFWNLLLNYCFSRDEDDLVSLQIINNLYSFFSDRFFRFSSGRNSKIMLDTLNDVCHNWLKRFGLLSSDRTLKSSAIDGRPHYLLKVLQLLAHSPDLTIEEISLRSDISIETLNVSLKALSMPSNGMFLPKKMSLDKEYYSNFIQYFLEHCFIVSSGTQQGEKFKLSIFGIMLLLTYMDQRNHSFSASYIKKLDETYDMIASNYGNCLPLIFGKWPLQKKLLKYMAMQNFRKLLNKEERYSGKFKTSVVLQGIGEYYESMKNIVLYNNLTTKEIYNSGYDALNYHVSKQPSKRHINLKSNKAKTNSNGIHKRRPIIQKLVELSIMHKHQYAQNYAIELFRDRPTSIPIEIFSRGMQDEMTFIYYLNLLQRYQGLDIRYARKYLDDTEKICSPYEALSIMLEQDGMINQWFSNWMKDIRQYQNDTFDIIKNYEETKQFVFKEERIDKEEDERWD
jgi:hypothetical protein